MRLALGLRIERRQHEKDARHYQMLVRHHERQLKQHRPGSKAHRGFSDLARTYRRLHAEAMAEAEKLTRLIKSSEREEKP